MTSDSEWQSAFGKVILFGEHAVVYGVEAVAAGIPDAVRARVTANAADNETPSLHVQPWNLSVSYIAKNSDRNAGDEGNNVELLGRTFSLIVDALGLADRAFSVELVPRIPAASGLGASAAIAVATLRALNVAFDLGLTDEGINDVAYRCEQLAHGTPSGLDNTLATYGGLLAFRRQESVFDYSPIDIAERFELVVAHSGKQGFTAEMVSRVRALREKNLSRVNALFEKIDEVRELGVRALAEGDMGKFAECLNRNQYILRELGVSCAEIEKVIDTAQKLGAQGAKLTGSGGGGAIIIYDAVAPTALCQQLNVSHINALCVSVGG